MAVLNCKNMTIFWKEEMNMKVQGIIFDVDGTLLDSMPFWKNVGNRFLASVGVEPKEDTEERLLSMSLYDAAIYYKNECGVPMSEQGIIDSINKMMEEFYMNEDALKPGMSEILALFHEHGIKMCIATATDRYLIEAALRKNIIDKYFLRIFTCNEVGMGKEDPLIFDTAAEYMGTDRSNTVVFEDALYAVRTAKKAGYTVIAVADAQSGNPAPIIELADYYVDENNIVSISHKLLT